MPSFNPSHWFHRLNPSQMARLLPRVAASLLAVHTLVVVLGFPGQAEFLPAAGAENLPAASTPVSTDHAIPQDTFDTAAADQHIADTLTSSFHQEFSKVLADCKSFLKSQKGSRFRHQRQAVVLDLDETLLDNRAYFVVHKRYEPTLWHAWVGRGEATAIPEALAFVDWLNRENYRVYFVSGRKEKERTITEANLKRIGVTRYDGLYLKPDDFQGSSAANFKVDARKAIEAKGQKVLLILGDQWSDLSGGYGKGFKLPNPIYQIP